MILIPKSLIEINRREKRIERQKFIGLRRISSFVIKKQKEFHPLFEQSLVKILPIVSAQGSPLK